MDCSLTHSQRCQNRIHDCNKNTSVMRVMFNIHLQNIFQHSFKCRWIFFSREEISFSIRFNFSVLSSLDNVSSTDDNTDSSTSSKFSASNLNISRNAFSITTSSTALLCGQFAIPLFVAVRHFHTGFLCFVS